MKRTTKILSKAGVLLIAAAMLLSAVPAVVADTDPFNSGLSEDVATMIAQRGLDDSRPNFNAKDYHVTNQRVPYGDSAPFAVGAPGDIIFEQAPMLSGWSATTSTKSTADGADYIVADNYAGLTEDIGEVNAWGLSLIFSGGWLVCDPTPGMVFNVFFYDEIGVEPVWGDPVEEFYGLIPTITNEGDVGGYDMFFYELDLPSVVSLTDGQVGVQADVDAGASCWFLWMSSAAGDGISYQQSVGTVDNDQAFQLIAGAGGGPVGDCLEDQCDFVVGAINMQEGMINELPQLINVSIANLGEIGIGEVKLLADVYKKICGPTSDIYDDEKYNLQTWESEVGDVWTMTDDGDGDTWVLQGGADNRWLTNNQAWRSTAGEDRSYGGDEDTYLGLCDTCAGPDELIWNPTGDDNVISGAACAEFTFNHWMEGEYTFDEDGNVVPVDYGTLSYSLDGGATWTNISISDFVAYDTEDEWETISIKFINTGIYEETDYEWQHPYSVVCDDCEPEEGEIVFYEDFPTIAELAIKFNFFKDPCLNFEGWYIDDLDLTRTEDYELELVHQTHEILELPGCDPEVDPWMYFEFPLGWDPEPDTWYQMEICGQVFDPAGCEINVDNNCIYSQFFVTDIHDIMCKDIELLTDPVTSPGEPVSVNMTVQNIGTYAESNIPVELLVGDAIVNNAIDAEFETDPSGDLSFAFFTGYQTKNLWRWTEGDPSIDMIYDIDEASARSKLPGSESLICANEGVMPYMEEEIGCMAYPNEVFDLSEATSASLSFYTKWSLEIETVYDSYYGTTNVIPGSEGVKASLLVHPTTGPDSAFWWIVDFGAWNHNGVYHNDWINIEVDMLDVAEGFAFDGVIPPIEFGWGVFTFGIDGDTANGLNPVPWSGIMLDRIDFDIIGCENGGTVVDETTISTLAPGEEATVMLTWDEAVFCTHCLTGDVQLATDINPENDKCTTTVQVIDFTGDFDFDSIDLTGDGDCLWDLCNNRPGGDDHFAWAGINEEQWAHYVNDMDDSFISPTIDLSDEAAEGAVINFTTWYKFFDDGDFGKVYVRGSPAESWNKLAKLEGDSGDVFVDQSYYVEEEYCTATTQFNFRMVSDDDGVSEGWYIDDVEVVDVTGVPTLAPGDVLWDNPYYDGGGAVTSTVSTADGADYICADDFTGLTADIGGVKAYGLSLIFSGGWLVCDPTPGMVFNVFFYADAYGSVPTTPVQTFSGLVPTIVNEGTVWSGSYDLYSYEMTLPSNVALTDGWVGVQADIDAGASCWFLWLNSIADNNVCYQYDGAVWSDPGYGDSGFQLFEGAPSVFVYGDTIFYDDFEREDIAPWTCKETIAGDFWHHSTDVAELPNAATDLGDPGFEVINGYGSGGKGLNDATYTELDLTEFTYAEFDCAMDYDFAQESAYIEISADWEPGTPMEDGTWITFWGHVPGDSYGTNTGGWVQLSDVVGDDRFVLNQYLGDTVYIRFRLTTPGEGASVGDGWAIDDLMFTYKTEGPPGDNQAPVTSISFNADTGQVTLIAQDFPLNKNSGVKATYYDIGDGQETYSAPFTIPEGETTIKYWSEDNAGNVEGQKTANYVVDTTPPTVEFISPEEGKLYLFGSPLMNRILGSNTLCIGKVPIEVDADDGDGKGISLVTFAFDNGDSGFADSAPYSYVYRGMHFGALTITATAIDNAGLVSQPAQMEVTVYSLGLL